LAVVEQAGRPKRLGPAGGAGGASLRAWCRRTIPAPQGWAARWDGVMEDDDLDLEEVGRLLREAVRKSRGYATWWEYAPKRSLEEHGAAQTLLRYLARESMSGKLILPDRDPPDLVLEREDGGRIGIEVTELVDEAVVERFRYLSKNRDRQPTPGLAFGESAEWPEERISDKLDEILFKKDRKLLNIRQNFDAIVLAITTDEPEIDEPKASRVISAYQGSADSIDRAFLMLGYDPRADKEIFPDGCPIFEISLQKSA